MTVQRRTIEHVQVDLHSGRALRVEVTRDASGEPETLRLVVGFVGPWRPERDQDLLLPGGALPALREALGKLEEGP